MQAGGRRFESGRLHQHHNRHHTRHTGQRPRSRKRSILALERRSYRRRTSVTKSRRVVAAEQVRRTEHRFLALGVVRAPVGVPPATDAQQLPPNSFQQYSGATTQIAHRSRHSTNLNVDRPHRVERQILQCSTALQTLPRISQRSGSQGKSLLKATRSIRQRSVKAGRSRPRC